MKAIREWKWLDSPSLRLFRSPDVWSMSVLWVGLPILALLETIPFLAWLYLLLIVGLVLLPSLSVLNNIDDSSKRLIKLIWSLPKEDQKLLPYNLIETLSLDLSPQMRNNIHDEVMKTYDTIRARDKQRARFELEAKRAGYSDEHIIAELNRAREHVQIEIDTLKEFS